MSSLSPAQLMRYLRILRADLPRIANGETPATDLLEWPRDVLDFLWRRVGPLHDHQLPPERACDDWTTWLVLGGRGAGKTRAGAEWVMGLASASAGFRRAPVGRIALVGETFAAARDVMIEGPAGLLAIHAGRAARPGRRRCASSSGRTAPSRMSSRPRTPTALRGPQFEAAWCDELAKWRHVEETWDMLQFGLRLGRASARDRHDDAAADPAPERLLADERIVKSRARTADNAHNLAPGFPRAVVDRYAGTRLGRQELEGEIIEDRPDALWTRDVDRGAARRARAGADAHRRRGRPAGLDLAARRRLRHRRGGRRRGGRRLRARRRDRAGRWRRTPGRRAP